MLYCLVDEARMLWKAGTFGHVPSQGVVGSAITNDLIKGAFLAFLVARLVDLRRFAGVSTLVVATFGYGDFFCDGTALNCGGPAAVWWGMQIPRNRFWVPSFGAWLLRLRPTPCDVLLHLWTAGPSVRFATKKKHAYFDLCGCR